MSLTGKTNCRYTIGPKTAKRLQKVGITTVQQLIACDAEEVAKQLGTRYIDAELVEEWQSQAELVCSVPNLRGHDAQVLVACGYEEASDIAEATADELLAEATEFANSREGKRILRSSAPPDLDEVEAWIEWAGLAGDSRTAA